MALPLLAIPILSVVTAGGVGYAVGSWWSGGWLKWAIILVLVVFLFTQVKNMGLVK